MKVLSIDGGGIRGIVPAIVLAEVERRTGRATCDLFDLVAGTSTGGILACALTRPAGPGASTPAYSAAELVGLYESEGPSIFARSLRKRVTSLEGWVDERYRDDGLNAALEKYLGATRLREALAPILVTAYDIKDRFAFFFRSERARRDPTYDFSMVAAARATAAAPTYFEPYEVTDAAGDRTYPLVDGGVYAVNPAMCAVAELRGRVELVASLGTGGQTRGYGYEQARGWGQLGWARPLIDIVFDGVADTVDFQVRSLLPEGGYVRLQRELTEASGDLDDASPQNLKALKEEARLLLSERANDVEALCERLVA